MSNTDQIRSAFDDNDFLTIDDPDFDSLFLANHFDDSGGLYDFVNGECRDDDFSQICAEFGVDFKRIDSDFVAIFWR